MRWKDTTVDCLHGSGCVGQDDGCWISVFRLWLVSLDVEDKKSSSNLTKHDEIITELSLIHRLLYSDLKCWIDPCQMSSCTQKRSNLLQQTSNRPAILGLVFNSGSSGLLTNLLEGCWLDRAQLGSL